MINCADILLADGFEDAYIGLAYPWQIDRNPVAVYDRQKCINILMERDGMSEEEAQEFLDFNVEGAYAGKRTPIFVSNSDHETEVEVREQVIRNKNA